jgi:hypothetical protein
MIRTAHVVTALITAALWATVHLDPAQARGFKVYGYNTSPQGEVEAAYWFTHVLQSGSTYPFFSKTVDKEGLSQHALELEYGVTDRWMVSGYLDFEDHPDGELQYAQFRAVMSRYRLFEQGERFMDTAIYFEYYIPQASYQRDEKLEARLIFERTSSPSSYASIRSSRKHSAAPTWARGRSWSTPRACTPRWAR